MPKTTKAPERPKVLIVEDSKDFSDLLKFVLEDDGFEGVQFRFDREDFVEWVKEERPAVVLMDLALRRKDGREFIHALKAESDTRSIPIIVVTGRDLTHKEVLELQTMDVKYMRKGRVEMDEIRSEVKLSAGAKGPRG